MTLGIGGRLPLIGTAVVLAGYTLYPRDGRETPEWLVKRTVHSGAALLENAQGEFEAMLVGRLPGAIEKFSEEEAIGYRVAAIR